MRAGTLCLATALMILAACGGSGEDPAAGPEESATAMAGQEVDQTALEELAAADSAAVSTSSVYYEFKTEASGPMASAFPSMTGSVRIVDSGEEVPWMRVELRAETDRGLDSLELTSTPDSVFLLDHVKGELRRGAVRNGADELMAAAGSAILGEFLFEDPFGDEMEAPAVRDGGEVEVDEVRCRRIEVEYAGGEQRAVWFFALSDHLPRRVERTVVRDGVENTLTMDLYNLRTDLDPRSDAYSLAAPEGYAIVEHMTFLPVGRPAPDWKLATSLGDTLSLAGLRDTLVVMDFWATWCAPCLMVMPELQSIHEEYAGQPVKVVGVNVWEQGDPQALMADSGFTYKLLLDGDSVAADYLVSGIPTLYLIDMEGRVLYRARGAGGSTGEELRAAIDSVLER